MLIPELQNLRSDLLMDAASQWPAPRGYLRPRRADCLPILVSGGVGDVILAMPLVKRLRALVGKVELYTNHPEVADVFYDEVSTHTKSFKGYDYYMSLNSVPKFFFSKNFKGFPNLEIQNLYYKYSINRNSGLWSRFIYYHPWLDNLMAEEALKLGLNRESLPYYLLGLEPPDPIEPKWRFLSMLGYITIHDGFELNQGHIKTRATKTWSIGKWQELIRKINEDYGHIRIWQLGGSTSRPIPGVDRNLIGKTTITKSLEILSHSIIHIDGDSGLTHAATKLRVPTIAMFGPTPAEFFGHKENTNISPNKCGGCWWLKRDWLQNCALGYDSPECMDSISVDQVFAEISKMLGKKNTITLSPNREEFFKNENQD